MLFKFSTSDMLNTELLNAHTGQVTFTIRSLTTFLSGDHNDTVSLCSRKTSIINADRQVVAEIEWDGDDKRQVGDIRILDEEPVQFPDLFDGRESVEIL